MPINIDFNPVQGRVEQNNAYLSFLPYHHYPIGYRAFGNLMCPVVNIAIEACRIIA